MEYKQLTENKFILRFDSGDTFGSLFRAFLEEHQVASGFFTGIGSTEVVTLGFYDTKREGYDWKDFPGMYEITNLTGNISLFEGKPVYHIHITLSGHDFAAFGGHLKDMIVGATCEIMLVTTPETLMRAPSSRKELNTLSFKL